MARIAVVVPVYNRSAVVMRAVDSVLRQDLADFELIVVDDASRDGSAELIAAIDDSRVRLLRQPTNRGANAARNRGLAAATAPLVAFLDSDDEFLPDKLSTVTGLFDQQPDLDVLLDSYRVTNPAKNGGTLRARVNPVIDNSEVFLAALFDRTTKSRRLRMSASGMTVRRAIALRTGGFNETLRVRQDMELLARLAKTGRCAATDRILWIKHDLPDGITASGSGYMAATIAMCRQHPEMLSERSARDGLSRDIVRRLWSITRSGKWRGAAHETGLLVKEFGASTFARLIARGVIVLGSGGRGGR